ncbi:MAG: PQQ-binding-like beta-propeller repeat protein [Alphaproteobacteria bacterium]|nr:PQQ-binding-like beta-propeller repeat protein [Alphaproteobacteria bacterium]
MRLRIATISAVAALLTVGMADACFAQQADESGAGASLFDSRCKSCHDPAIGRAPSREDLAQRTPESVVQALTAGTMQPMASGLSPEMIGLVATYVTGKPLTQMADATPAGRQPPDTMCASTPPIRSKATDWNGYGATAASNRFQAKTSLTPANVGRLKVKWSFALAGGRAGQPTIIGDRMFLVTFAGDAYSLDAKTGCVYWRSAIGSPMRQSPLVVHRPGDTPSGWVMYVGDFNRDFRALDAMTGKEIWKTNLDPHPLSMLTGAPVIEGDRIYVPVSSSEETMGALGSYSCCTFAGAVVALDIKSGKIAWRTQLLDPKPTRTNAAGTQLYGPAGAAIWSQPTLDAKRGQLYVATGDSYTEADAPTADAIVAIGLADGEVRWATQVTRDDNFLIACGRTRGVNCPLGEIGPDHDFGASPILFSLKGGKQIVLAGQKSGAVYGVDPDTGKQVWMTQVGAGSALGGIEWGMAADKKALYVAVSDSIAPKDKAHPGVYALDPATGEFLWKAPAPSAPCGWTTRRCSNAQSAPVSVIPGVVFSGGQDGWLRGYDSKTGKALWEFNSAGQTYATTNGVAAQPGGSFDHTGVVVSGGALYAISGYNGATGAYGNPLNVLLAFTIEGK